MDAARNLAQATGISPNHWDIITRLLLSGGLNPRCPYLKKTLSVSLILPESGWRQMN